MYIIDSKSTDNPQWLYAWSGMTSSKITYMIADVQ